MIIITGAKGYIGKLVTQAVRNIGFNDILEIDLKNGQNIKDYHGLNASVLIHLAAFTSVTESSTHFESYINNNITHYCQFLKNNHFGRIIYASSAAVYASAQQVYPRSIYAMTKLNGEYMTEWRTPNHLNLRFGNPVGLDLLLHDASNFKAMAYGEPNLMIKLAKAKQKGIPFQLHDSDMIRDFFPVQQIASTIAQHLHSNLVGNYYLGSGKTIKVATLVEAICTQFDIEYVKVPKPPEVSNGYAIPCLLNESSDFDMMNYVIQAFSDYLKVNWN